MSRMSYTFWCLGIFVLLFGACQTGGERREEDDIVGKPPSVNEDPFAYAALPAPTQRAETTGTIEVDPPKRVEPQAEPKVEPKIEPKIEPQAPVQPPTEVAVVTEPTPPQEVATRVAPAVPVEPVEPPTPDIPHCFSCVRICAQSDPTDDCSQSVEDMICGWGTAEDERAASQLAQAQCDAVLDMARQMSRWRTIEGSCPKAACR